MTDRPILFSGPMIRALLDGRKTQTRRWLSSKSGTGPAQSVECISGYWMACEYDRRWPIRLPYASGDRLWVREAMTEIEHLYYMEGREVGWRAAHMCGVANRALAEQEKTDD